MTLKSFLIAVLALAIPVFASANDGAYQIQSPDGHLQATVVVGEKISYTVSRDELQLIAPSSISMTVSTGEVFGLNDKVRKVRRTSIDLIHQATAYKKAEVRDNYNEMTLEFKEFSLVFRAFDDGVAYRFVSSLKGDFNVVGEQAEFAFAKDWTAMSLM